MRIEDLKIIGLNNLPDLFDIHEYIPNLDDFTAFEIRGYGYERPCGYHVYAIDINNRSKDNENSENTVLFHIRDVLKIN